VVDLVEPMPLSARGNISSPGEWTPWLF